MIEHSLVMIEVVTKPSSTPDCIPMEIFNPVRHWLVCVLILLFVSPVHSEEIELVSGEVLKDVSILERTPDVFIVQHIILGRLEIPVASIRTVNGRPVNTILVPTRSPRDTKTTEPPPVESPPPGPPETPVDSPPPTNPPAVKIEPDMLSKPRIPWKSQLEFGGALTDGATETSNFTIKFHTTRNIPTNTTRVDVNYRLTTNKGDTTINRFNTGIFSDWKSINSKWSVFAQGRFESAEFESWDQRITASGGLGYLLMDVKDITEQGKVVDRFSLTGRLGGGIRNEFGSVNEDIAPEGLVGLDFDYHLNEEQQITGSTRYFPDFNESGEFRLESRLDWTINIDKMKGVSLRLGLQHEYDSLSPSNIPKNDIAARATLVINF